MTSTEKGNLPGGPLRRNEFRRTFPDGSIPDLLAALAELEATTRPQDGEETARGKDRKSGQALRLANELVRAVAGWAIDHQTGLALHGQASTIEVLPELGRHPLLSIALANVDNHRHEEAGVENDSVKLRDPVVARQALQNLLQANPGAFPVIITFQIIRAIEALDYNEVDPILQPRKERRKISRSELNMQLCALRWVAHYNGRGFKKKDSLERVADAFGVSIATLRSWERRVPDELGKLRVDSLLEDSSVYDDKYEDQYDENLISDGKAYRELLKQKK